MINLINVTRTYLPNRDKYKEYVDQIFDSGWLTNNGTMAQLLQKRLENYLGVKNLLLVSNGTMALQVAYKLLKLTGEVITTPFSFVATTSSILWGGLTPVFVDIDPKRYTLDPTKIEEKITANTSAIVATHVYGNACDVESIEQIAIKNNLKVIYDAAHAFGVNYNSESLLNHGDISIISFHSTKIFHTIEGGALVINDDALFEKAKQLINFGIVSPTEIVEVGINAKLNEFQAAMGLCLLDDIEEIIENRRKRYEHYFLKFKKNKFLILQEQNTFSNKNYSHFPLLFDSEYTLLEVIDNLNKINVNPRRYFYPSLNNLNYFENKDSMPISEDIAKRILCLPLFHDLDEDTQDLIIQTIMRVVNK